MDWISATLREPAADWYHGWISAKKIHDIKSAVSVAYGDFVVVIRVSVKVNGALKGKFVTCYNADNSIAKIKQSPVWTLHDCKTAFGV